jgi:WD40 repeat protein
MKFSKNGKYLASAGQDAVVRVWEICLKRGEPEDDSGAQPGSEDSNIRCMPSFLLRALHLTAPFRGTAVLVMLPAGRCPFSDTSSRHIHHCRAAT